MYALHFQLCLGSFDSEPPHCKILLFLNLSVIKKQSIICQESQVLIPIHILQAFSGAPALTVSGKTLGQRHEALGEAQTKPCREQHWQSHRNLCVCAHMCACVLEDSRQICSGINMICGYSLFTTLPRCFSGFGEQMIIGYIALE